MPPHPGDDLQRPLEESVPASTPLSPAGEPLRPAIPGQAAGPDPSTGPGAGAGPGPDAGPEAGAGHEAGAGPDNGATGEPAGTASAVSVTGAAAVRAGRLVRGLVTAPVRMVRAGRRGGRRAAGWARGPAGRMAVPGALIGALIVVAVTSGAFVVPATGLPAAEPTPGASGPDFPGPVAPTAAPPPPPAGTPGPGGPDPAGHPAEVLTAWAEQAADRTGIPMVAVRAYGYAELVSGATFPSCRLSWTTLAGIGRIESNHGSSGGATLIPDGRALPAIIGAPLDGQGDRREISDTDRGQIDGDTVYDRAVGPMQFIPQTWRSMASPVQGIADIHNINDAALAAAKYLCLGGRDLSTGAGWWPAILSYNNVQSYAEAVFNAAHQYGQQSR